MNNNLGTIYLSGGGDGDTTKAVDAFFLKNSKIKNILFIPVAKTSDMNGYRKSRNWLADKLSRLSRDAIDVSMSLDFSKIGSLNDISAIYIGGGNTYKLLKLMSDSGFLDILKKYIYAGGVVYGASAGAVLMGKDISTYIEEKYTLENREYNYTLSCGMAFLGDYSVMTHFQEGDCTNIEEYFIRGDCPILALPEGAGVMVRNSLAKVIGDKAIAIFSKENENVRRIRPGEIFVI